MQFEKASSSKLIFVMIRSMVLIALCLVAWSVTDSVISRAFAIVTLAGSLASLRNAYKLDDTPGPLLSMGPRGVVISPALSAGKLIPWDDIRSIDCYTYRLYHVIPIYSYLIVRVRGREYLTPFQIWAQFGWLRAGIMIPSAYFEGGSGVTKLMKKRAAAVREGARHAQVGSLMPDPMPAAAIAGPVAHPAVMDTSPTPAAASGGGDMDYDDVIARYLAARTDGSSTSPAPVRAPAVASAATYVPPGSPNYVVRGNREPLLNGKPFPRDDRPAFGRKAR
ncbi:MAG: hypothetical protein U5M50_09900 [Sphingobium sp.]|nr:hypothetical protein [Sphingobium sp.]